MRLPLSWLYDYVEPAMTPRALATRLAMTGTEVERIHRHGVDELEAFVVGKVLTAQQHPNADRLRVCTVDVGAGEPSHIVCGAPNVAAGQTVAVAKPGAIMPDGTRLKKAKLRGEPSEGMILAEDEVGIGTDHAGIMVLDDEHEAGELLAAVLPIATDVLELEITPNRPDCLGVYGVAREVHAATNAPLAPAPWEGIDLGAPAGIDGVTIEVRDPDLCPRFTAVAYEGVTIGPSPRWLKQRLMACGQRPINNVVDITNYVMLLTGQPVHAFDLDRIAGGRLVVRRANPGEELTTLDDQVRRLPADAMLIEDAEGPTSIGGLMGGERSEVSEHSTRVLLEMATWDGPNIHATSNALGLRTEASGRFEKGLSPEGTVEAQAVALQLMQELTGATRLPGWIDVGGPGPQPAVIRLREARVRSLLGIEVRRSRQAEVLRALGFGVADAEDGLDVTVPHWRRLDVTREADVIEEVARLAALDDLPATLPRNRPGARLTWRQRVRRRAEDVLVGRGVQEIAGWSFASPGLLDRLRLPADSPLRRVVVLDNPMSEEDAILRPTLLGSLLEAARHNLAHGVDRVALFDSGTVYRANGASGAGDAPPYVRSPADEHHGLGVLLAGPTQPATWRSPKPPAADFFAAKALVGAVLDALRVPWDVEPAADWPFLHPGRSAEVAVGEARVGFVGELHPLVARAWDLPGGAAFAIDLGKVADRAPETPVYRDVTTFPPVRQDLSLLVGDRSAAEVIATVRMAGGALLRDVSVFDRFTRDDEVSLALHLEFAAPDRTLTDEEVVKVREKILARLAEEGVTPRG